MGSYPKLPDHCCAYLIYRTKMKLLKFLLPFLVVASCSAFSLDALFSSEKEAEELPAEDSAAEEIDEDIDEEEEEIDEEDAEEEEEVESVAIEAEDDDDYYDEDDYDYEEEDEEDFEEEDEEDFDLE